MYNDLERQIAVARCIFSKMPDALFDAYRSPLIHDVGNWPFQTCDDITYGTDWYRLFCVVSMHELASCSWTLGSFTPTVTNITPQSLGDITQLVQNYNGALLRLFSNYDYEYCRASTAYHIKELKEKDSFTQPVALYPINGKFHVMDGNHRIAAALLLSTLGQTFSIPAWVAKV